MAKTDIGKSVDEKKISFTEINDEYFEFSKAALGVGPYGYSYLMEYEGMWIVSQPDRNVRTFMLERQVSKRRVKPRMPRMNNS